MFLSNLLSTPKPTLLELQMSDSLAHGLQPAFEYLLRVLGEHYSALFPLFQYKDELFLALSLAVQRHFLASYEGSFAENFYALKRTRVVAALAQSAAGVGTGGATGRPLTGTEKLLSLVILTLLPYLRSKVEAAHHWQARELDALDAAEARVHERQPEQQRQPRPQPQPHQERQVDYSDEGPDEPPRPSQAELLVRRAFVHLWPLGLAAHEAWGLWLKVLFAFEREKYHSTATWLLGVSLERVTGDDMRAQAARDEAAAKGRSVLGRLLGRLAGLLRSALVASALLLKLFEWYWSPENQSQREQLAGPALIPPPPAPPKVRGTGVCLPRDPALCPICHEARKNAAISSSGLAYCFLCIHRFVSEHGQDPITLTPCQPAQIRRIFAS